MFFAASLAFVCFHVIGMRVNTLAWSQPEFARYHRYMHESFGDFLWQLVGHGSLGRGLRTGGSLTLPIVRLAPVTLSLAGGAVVFALLVGVPLGLAWSRRRLVRPFASPFIYLALGLFPIWVGLLLSYYLGFRAGLLPSNSYCDFFSPPRQSGCNGPPDWLAHLILPSITLGLPVAAVYTRVTHKLAQRVSRAREEATGDCSEAVRAARRKALIAFAKQVARNASWLIGATVFVEVIFSLPGLGYALIQSLYSSDPAAMEGILIVATLLAVGLSLVVDLIGASLSREWQDT